MLTSGGVRYPPPRPDPTRQRQRPGCRAPGTENIELKKLVYLYLINYAKTQPELTLLAVNTFVKDANDPNPLIRALAVRTMGCIRVEKITEYLCEPLRKALRDEARKDARLRFDRIAFFRTCAYCRTFNVMPGAYLVLFVVCCCCHCCCCCCIVVVFVCVLLCLFMCRSHCCKRAPRRSYIVFVPVLYTKVLPITFC